jgi:Domain of unknown function (DUF4177)
MGFSVPSRARGTGCAWGQPVTESQNGRVMNGFEYKVLTQKDRYFGGKFDPLKLQTAMNSYAQEGWRVVCVTSASAVAMGTNREELIVVFERAV